MRTSASLYKVNGSTAIALHPQEDIYMRAPPDLRPLAKPFCHVKFSYDGRSRGIDVYLMDRSDFSTGQLFMKRVVRLDDFEDNPSIDERNDVRYEIIKEFRDTSLEKNLISAIRRDIQLFARSPGKHVNPSTRKYVDRIIPVTKIRYVNKDPLLEDGKPDFVEPCIYDANKDSAGGCITGFLPGLTPSFDGTYFVDYWSDAGAECGYCYDLRNHKAFPKTIFNLDPEQLREELRTSSFLSVRNPNYTPKKVRFLRLGKGVEEGSIFTRPQLHTTLDVCIEEDVQCIIPNKMLEFDPEIAKKLKRSKSVYLSSIGPEDKGVERGTVEYGCTNEWKMEQTLRYKEAGVNAAFFLLTVEPGIYDERQRSLIEFAKKHRINVQLLPMDFPSKDLAQRITGVPWDVLKKSYGRHVPKIIGEDSELIKIMQGTYYSRGNGDIAPETLSEETQELVGKNTGHVGLCYHNSGMAACRGCFLQGGVIVDVKEKKVVYKRIKAARSAGRDERRKHRDQHKLKFGK